MIALTAMESINMMENKTASQSSRKRAVPVYFGCIIHEVILGTFLGVNSVLKLLMIPRYHLLKVTLAMQELLKSKLSTIYQVITPLALQARSHHLEK
jgi:hypothetical protein